ncbi:IS66 family insertion sequence element accessory protein TnpB [Pontibacter qinzhouensis]|uniref:IS66 family insertion sequence element accessory protein TnpB n=2 Tax=Pontibacter qinzhouensis TaxID=2603253 RepID=A0A5C8IJ57_9BACT|nr:IS66 family insertion sequence element accessory protein TnpB [Pontibacter qinzhouensis]
MLRLVAVYEQSGQSQKAFCDSAGLNLSRFGYWVRKVRKEREPTAGFIKVDTGALPMHAPAVELVYPNGVKLKLHGADLQLISQLLRL